jgi:hypothetical protein
MAKACADAIAVDRERGTKKKKKKSSLQQQQRGAVDRV